MDKSSPGISQIFLSPEHFDSFLITFDTFLVVRWLNLITHLLLCPITCNLDNPALLVTSCSLCTIAGYLVQRIAQKNKIAVYWGLLAAAHISSTSRNNFVPLKRKPSCSISFAIFKSCIVNEFLEPLLSSNGLPQRHILQAKIKNNHNA